MMSTKRVQIDFTIPKQQKEAIASRIMNECADALGIDPSYVWVYVNDADKTAEFGKILPKPGEEKEWFKSIPDAVKERYHMFEG